jgi:hypothetical protein
MVKGKSQRRHNYHYGLYQNVTGNKREIAIHLNKATGRLFYVPVSETQARAETGSRSRPRDYIYVCVCVCV